MFGCIRAQDERKFTGDDKEADEKVPSSVIRLGF